MATRKLEESTAPMKEKRGSSSSNPPGKINPKPSQTDPHLDPIVRTPTSSEKHVGPNYLKATLSSGLEAAKRQGKKPVDSYKPMLRRRRSFDSKPQSPTTQSQRSLNPTLRSSSFSGKTTVSVRGNNNKDGASNKQHGTVSTRLSVGSSRTLKKQICESSSTKKVITSPVDTTENASTEIADATVVEINSNPRGEGIVQAIGEDDDEKGVLESELEQVVPDDHRTQVMEIRKDDDDGRISINEDETSKLERIVTSQEDAEEHNTNKDHLDGNDDEAGENVGETYLKGQESAKNDDTANLGEDKAAQAKEEVKPKTETLNNAASKYQGKRESAVSNDVIEETASKLREQKKNKVKALAGAFETVISSLQEPK